MFKVNAQAQIEKQFFFFFLHMLSYTICWHMIYQQMLGGRGYQVIDRLMC